MATYKIEVTRILRSTKPFYIEDHGVDCVDETCLKTEAIEAACQEAAVGDSSGWIEDVEWVAEILYNTPRVGDTVRYANPHRCEEGFRFIVREIVGDDAFIELRCSFDIKPTLRVRRNDICLASTEE